MFKTLYLLIMSISVSTLTLFDFNSSSNMDAWEIENDTVMGGRSSSSIKLNDQGHAVFSGYVTTENNGGFAQTRHDCNITGIEEKETVMIRLKGDGKKYQLRFKKNINDRASYVYNFETSGEWETVTIPVNEMYATFRGRTLDLPNFSGDRIEEVAILIGNKRNEEFSLIIDKIEMR